MTLGLRIQELRKERGLSQEALGQQLGVSRQAVSRWEMDGAVPEVDKLIAMSRIFGVDLNDLLQVDPPDTASGEEQAQDSALPPPASGPQRRLPRLLPLAGAAVLVLSLLLFYRQQQGAVLRQLSLLEDRMTALEEEKEALSAAAPLVSDARLTLGTSSARDTIAVLVTPYQLSEDMELSLIYVLESSGFSKELKTTQREPGLYYAAFPQSSLELPVTLTALISFGGQTYTQPLFRITSADSSKVEYDALWQI